MLNYQRFTKIIVLLILGTLFFVWLLNYVIDPYGKNYKIIFSGNKEKIIRDERIRKYDLMSERPNASSFIFGSSRALMLNAEKLGELTNTEAINLAFSSASAYEYYLFIKYLVETRKVSNVIVGIDLFAYTKNFVSNGLMPRELLSYFNMKDNYSVKNYFSSTMFGHSIDTLKRNYSYKTKPISLYTPRGKIIKKEYLQAKNGQVGFDEYIKKNVVEDSARWGSNSSELSGEQLNYLLNIKELCDKYKVNLYLFMSPLYIKQIEMNNNRFKQQQELLRFIVNNIHSVMDYNHLTKINTDPFYFIDSFHYSYDVADMILETFYSSKEKQKKYLVSKDNLKSHIDAINKKLLH